jgi:hypothetical protein
MPSDVEKQSWTIDQITKSKFFHQKLHDWGLLDIAYELEKIKGEDLKWNLKELNITERAWKKIIHKGIKPIRVFAHPNVLKDNARRISYYRMLAMMSQKSMARVGLSINSYEEGKKSLRSEAAPAIARHLNKIISILIEHDEKIDQREFDLWRGMAAGSQAQGSWQNTKGDKAEIVIKDLIKKRVRDKEIVQEERSHGKVETFKLKDGRILILGSEPDIGLYKDEVIQKAVEIKGGIDPAGVLERFGAALKSLRRAKQEKQNAITVLIMQGVSLTSTAKKEIEKSKKIIDYFFIFEKVLSAGDARDKLFKILEM